MYFLRCLRTSGLVLLTFPVFAQKQILKNHAFPSGIVADVCGISETSIVELERKFGKPKEKKSQLISSRHSEIKNTLTTYAWSSLKTMFLTLPKTKDNSGKTFLVSTQATKSFSPGQKVKIGDTRKEIEKTYGKLDAKMNPESSAKIEYWIEQEKDPDYISYLLDKGNVIQIDCIYSVD